MRSKQVYTRENIIEGIYKKVDSIKDASDGLKSIWKKELVNYPIEVEQNVLEWINGEPISDIDCHGYSMRTVLNYIKRGDEWFPFVLESFIKYKNTNFMMPSIVYGSLLRTHDLKRR